MATIKNHTSSKKPNSSKDTSLVLLLQPSQALQSIISTEKKRLNDAQSIEASESVQHGNEELKLNSRLASSQNEKNPSTTVQGQAKQQRILLNPQTFEMQQKFTIDKQEYQSVFRVLDKDNLGYISIDQVNFYLDKFETLHREQALKRLNEVAGPVSKPTKVDKVPSYMRSKHSVNGQVKKQHTGGSNSNQQVSAVIGAHLVTQEHHQQQNNVTQQLIKQAAASSLAKSQLQPSQANRSLNNQTQQNVAGATASPLAVVVNNQAIGITNNGGAAGHSKSIMSAQKQPYNQQQPHQAAGVSAAKSTSDRPKAHGKGFPVGLHHSGHNLTSNASQQLAHNDSKSQIEVGGQGIDTGIKQIINIPARNSHNRNQPGLSNNENSAQSTALPASQTQLQKFPNGKPTIEFEEFIDMIRESCMDSESAENYLVLAFSMFDVEKKGYIGSSDLREVFELLGETVSDDELQTMIKIAGQKSNDRITFKDFVDFFYKID